MSRDSPSYDVIWGIAYTGLYLQYAHSSMPVPYMWVIGKKVNITFTSKIYSCGPSNSREIDYLELRENHRFSC